MQNKSRCSQQDSQNVIKYVLFINVKGKQTENYTVKRGNKRHPGRKQQGRGWGGGEKTDGGGDKRGLGDRKRIKGGKGEGEIKDVTFREG